MAFSYPADQVRLQQLLGLDRNQLATDSLLHYLMDKTEYFDAQYGTNVADTIVSLATSIDEPTTGLQAQIEAARANANVRSLANAGEYSVTYGPGGQSAAINQRLQAVLVQIKALLDPEGHLYDRDRCYSKRHQMERGAYRREWEPV